MAREWFVRVMGDVLGPMEPTDLRAMVAAQQIRMDDEVRRGANGKWSPAGEVAGLFSQAPATDPMDEVALSALGGVGPAATTVRPPPLAPSQSAVKHCPMCREVIALDAKKCKHCGEILDQGMRRAAAYKADQASRKSKSVVLALLLFLGGFLGFHRLYAGHIATGIVMLGLGLTGVGWIVTVPWAIVDLISVLSGSFLDGEGRELV